MGLFEKLKGKKQSTPNNRCPHCNAILEPVPQRKKKCPICNQYIFVRTRPLDKQRVLVTEEGSKQIDDDWAKIREEKNKALYAEHEAANLATLRHYKEEGLTHVEIYPAPDACSICRGWAGVHPINKTPLLPIRGCRDSRGCRCTYLAVID